MHKNFAAVALLQTPLGYFWRMEVLTVGGGEKGNICAPAPILWPHNHHYFAYTSE